MKRLSNQTGNLPDMSWDIFQRRWAKQVHFIDFPRFQMLAKHFKGGRYLDVGCFNSPMPFYLSQEIKDSEIHAIDHCEPLVEELQKRFPTVNYKCGLATELPYENEYFDYVVAGEIIEHLENPKKLIEECFRVLKPDGILALSTPFEEGISQPEVSNEHIWGFTESDIISLLDKYGEVTTELYRDSVPVIVAYAKRT